MFFNFQYIGTNSSAVKDQKRIIENEIQELRIKINNHLDKLQENLMKKLTEAETHVTCLSFCLTKFISQGFDSTTTSPSV
jgi:hypothetical protein